MKKLLAIVALVALPVFADVLVQQAGTTAGPVRAINCAADGGLLCTRTTAAGRGDLACNGATASEPGCVTPQAQTFGGNKTFNGDSRIVGHVHGSLSACNAGNKGNWQTCTTHNAPVFCDGSINIELTGTSAAERVLSTVNVNGVPVLLMGGGFSAQTATTVTAIEGNWYAGTGTSLVIRISDGSNNCDCTVSCTAPTTRTACSGSCSYAAGSTLTVARTSDTCSMNPYVGGNLLIKGTTP